MLLIYLSVAVNCYAQKKLNVVMEKMLDLLSFYLDHSCSRCISVHWSREYISRSEHFFSQEDKNISLTFRLLGEDMLSLKKKKVF